MNKALAALAAGAVLFVTAVVVTVLTRPDRVVVHDRPVVTTPIVSSPVTPLPRDSGPKNNAVKREAQRGSEIAIPTPRRNGPPQAAANGTTQSSTPSGAQRRPVVKTRPTPRPKPSRPASPQSGPQTSPSPSPAPRPPVDVTTPVAPVTVCVKGVGGVNC